MTYERRRGSESGTSKNVNDLQKSEREKALEKKLSLLENSVAVLEEKQKLVLQYCFDIEGTHFSIFYKLHNLIRSDSLERKNVICAT